MFWFEKEALQRISSELRMRFSDRIKGIYVFGSRVRGDHSEWSDLDILVIVKDKDINLEKEIIEIFTEERLKTGIPFAPVIKDIKTFEREKELNTPFYQDILREGIMV